MTESEFRLTSEAHEQSPCQPFQRDRQSHLHLRPRQEALTRWLAVAVDRKAPRCTSPHPNFGP